jgi:hypothetical protein
MGEEINQMISRVIPHLQRLWLPILIISVLMGLTLIIVGLYRFAGAGNRAGAYHRNPLSLSAVMVIAGIVLVNIPAALDTITMSTMQQASMQDMSYVPPQSMGRSYIQLAVYLIQLVGLCGFIRGWSLMGKIGSQGDSAFWRSTAHIIGGAWAVNIIGFFHMLGLSFGGPIQDAVSFTLG